MTRARPDAFVLLFPVSWSVDNVETLTETHVGTWQEEARYRLGDDVLDDAPLEGDAIATEDSTEAVGAIEFEDGEVAPMIVQEPMEQLEDAVGTGKQPFQASEVALLQQHTAVWRVVVETDPEDGVERALRAGRIASTFAHAGAAAVFLPAIVEMHSPSFVKEQTKGLAHEQSLANLFVGAWDEDDWMATRGLTCFGFPEIETPVEGGLNASFFRLMDAASGMMSRGTPYPVGARLEIGSASFEIEEGRQGPKDERVPISGTFGVQTLMPG
jgi:hypothetical protein